MDEGTRRDLMALSRVSTLLDNAVDTLQDSDQGVNIANATAVSIIREAQQVLLGDGPTDPRAN